jgi:hypothetical protein
VFVKQQLDAGALVFHPVEVGSHGFGCGHVQECASGAGRNSERCESFNQASSAHFAGQESVDQTPLFSVHSFFLSVCLREQAYGLPTVAMCRG